MGKPFSVMDGGVLLLKYKGVFDFEGMYRMMHAWIINKRFKFEEKLYKDKVYTPFGNEVEIEWECEKKVTEYVKEIIVIKFHLWDFAEVEVIKDGKKVKMTQSRMEIRFDAKLHLDYLKKFEKGGAFAKKLGKFYEEKIIYWEWRIKYANPLIYQLYDLHNRVKTFLNAESAYNAY